MTARRALVLAAAAGLVALTAGAEEPICPSGSFDQPEQVVREGRIVLGEPRTVAGAEIYLSNTSLRVAGDGVPFVLSGSDVPDGGGRLRLQAREEIVLGPGFHAQRGSRMEATIVRRPRAAAARRSLRPSDSLEADRAAGASETVVRPALGGAEPDPYRIPPMAPPRRAGRSAS